MEKRQTQKAISVIGKTGVEKDGALAVMTKNGKWITLRRFFGKMQVEARKRSSARMTAEMETLNI